MADYSEKINVDAETTIDRIWLPEKANNITVNNLKTAPFFGGGSEFGNLFGSMGPGNSVVRQERDKWLAEAFPALTGAAGGPDGSQLFRFIPGQVTAIDMQATFTNGWAQERIDKGDSKWKHSDLKNVSYLYLYNIFENMVNLTGAKP